jgi:ankyrin repeat protein
MWEGALQAEYTAATMRLKGHEGGRDISIRYPRITEAIHLATRAGAANLVASLLAKNDGSNFINCRDNNGCTALSYAASAGNVAILEILLANPLVDVDKRDYEGRTPIFYAAENGHALVVSRLLGHGANPNWKDLDGATPLWFAVQRDHVTVVKVLMESGKLSNLSSRQGPVTTTLAYALKNGFHEISEMIGGVDGIDPYACTEHGSTTVLGLAIHSGHESIALKLIEKHGTGQHSDDRQPGVRLLADAAYIGSTKLVESLLTIHKVDPNVTWMDEDSHNPHGLTPIMIAAQKGHGSVVRLLLDDKSIQLNKTHDFGTALSLAAANGFRDIVEMLMVDGRIDINQKNRKENTPLSLAAKDAHEDVVEALLKSDTIDANCRDYRGRTPLLKAAKGRYLGPNGQQIYDGVAVRLVSDARVDPNSRDNDGHTSLYYAAKHRLLGLVEAILRHSNADMGLQDEEPPISAAIEYGHVDVVRAFLKTGHVDVNRPVKYEGRYLERSILSSFESTLLSIAANKGREGIVDLLLSQSGIEPHKPDADGLTPLAMAALGGSEAQVDRLLKVKVVDPNSRDLRGRTPLHMAVRSPHPMGAIQALLRAKDIDMDPFDSQGMTPLSTLCRYNARAGLESINLLLACSTVNPDSKDAAGRTPLSWAVDTNDDEAEFNIRMKIIRRLLQIQAVNPNVEDGEGLTPLLRAIRGNHANELVRVLLEREDLDVQQPSMDGLTPMAFAKRTGDAAVISILRKKGALEEENQGPTDASDCDSDVERAMESQIILTTREESSSSRSSSQTRDSSSISERSAASYDWIEMSAQLSRSIVLPLNAPQQHVTLDKGDDGDMCERCSAIDLEDAFSLRHTDPRGRVIAKLGDVRRAWMARDCPMCRLIGAMGSRLQIPIDSDGGEEDSYEFALVALSSTGTWLCQNLDTSWQHFLHHWTDTMVLTLVPHALYEKFNGLGTDEFGRRVFEAGFIGRLGSNCEYGTSSISIHQVDAKVDYDVAKEWITCCREEHSTRCNPRNLAPIPHFWLIDCATRRIVQQVAQAPLYVALSYVWGLPAVARSGKKDHLEPCDAGLGKDVEAVVEDAISVTLGLGYRFLWVDRYCVLQDGDAKIKGEQLQSMDLVYANADVTLVAIAGQASSAGLPGVRSERPRAPQPSVQIKGHALTLIPPDPAIQIKSSAWMTRGWTYQEGLLSRRRLFFSETEMSFECADLVAREAIRLPSVVQRAMCHRTIRLMKPSWVYSQRRLISRRMGGSDLFDRLADYTRRELTYEHDALNAMLGVLRVYATHKKNPVYRVYGVPIIRDPEIDMASLVGGGHTSNEEASIALVGFMSGLCWTLRRPGVRRPRFPSWSWTGWDGVVNCSPRSPEIVSFANGFEVEVSIVLADGVSSIPWNDYYNRLRDAFNKEGRSGFAFSEYHTLDVTANTTMVRFYRQHDEFTKSTEWHGTVSIGDDIWCGDFELLHEDIPPSSGDNEAGTGSSLRLKLLEDSWLGIVLGSPPPSRCDEKGDVNGTYILVIQETPSSGVGGITHWERVGLLTISYSTIQSNILERRRLRLV